MCRQKSRPIFETRQLAWFAYMPSKPTAIGHKEPDRVERNLYQCKFDILGQSETVVQVWHSFSLHLDGIPGECIIVHPGYSHVTQASSGSIESAVI